MGVSRRTVYKWLKRWREECEAGLVDRSSRPERSPRALSRARVRQIERLRRKRWSGPRIAWELQLPLSTEVVVIRRPEWNRLERLGPRRPVIRYERKRAGELGHLDTKKLGRIVTAGPGSTATARVGRTGSAGSFCTSASTTRAAWPMAKSSTMSEAFLRRVARWYQEQGVTIESVMTDNDGFYVSKIFRKAVREIGARHIRTRPYTPRTDGRAGRFIRTALKLWAYACPYHISQERIAALNRFLNFYSCARPHWEIGRKTPQLRLAELLSVNIVLINHS